MKCKKNRWNALFCR